MNRRLKGYSASVRAVSFHPIGFSLTLRDLVFVQDARPDPPVLHVPRLDASVEWKALVFGRIVANFLLVDPTLYADRKHVLREAADATPLTQHGWQEAFEAIYPLKINELRIINGTVAYVDEGPFKPLQLSRLNLTAENIRNIRSKERTYPSDIHLEAAVFESGQITVDGHADFLAEPYAGMKAAVVMERIELDYFRPVVRRQNLVVRGGTLSAAGTFEYAPTIKVVDLIRATIRDVRVEYIHTLRTKGVPQEVTRRTVRAVQAANNAPDLQLRARAVDVVDSTVGFMNKTTTPAYRMFLNVSDLRIENFTNQRAEGIMLARLKGKFMGSGETSVVAHFRPETEGPNFDMRVAIEPTDMTRLNDVLRAYGKFDVVEGLFSFYSEVVVEHRQIRGYVKPLFKNIHAYNPEQDRAKSVRRKLYERVVTGVSKILKNIPREEVATKVDISGPVDNPRGSTFQAVIKLIQNAFFRAILPGIDRGARVSDG